VPAVPAVLRDSLAVDRGAFRPLRGLRSALAVTLALGIGIALRQPAAGVLATVGALTAGTVSLTQGARTPFARMALAGAATALSTTVGSLTAHNLAVELVALAVWAAVAGLLAGSGPAGAVVGVQAVVGLIVLGRFPMSALGAVRSGGEVLLGTAVQLLVCAVLRPPARDTVERQALAALADDLVRWCREPDGTWTGRTATELEEARGLLDRRPDAAGAAPLRALLVSLSRSRLEVSVLGVEYIRAPSERRKHIGLLLAGAADDLERLAEALRSGHSHPARGDEALSALLGEDAGPLAPGDLAGRRARALAGQLRGARVSLTDWVSTRPHPGDLLHAPHPVRLERLRQTASAVRHPTEAAARHAVRLAVLLPLAEGLARVLPLQRGYWVALTAVVVLKPDYVSSVRRGFGRMIGTLLGVVPVTLVVGVLHPRGLLLVAIVGVLAWAAYTSFQAGFALFSAWLAALVVVLLDVITPGGVSVALERAIDTVLGGAMALLAFLLLPAWEGPAVRHTVAALVEAEDRYAASLLAAYGGEPPSREELARLAGVAREARKTAEASVERAAAEPTRSGSPEHVDVARNALASTTRMASSLRVLHAQAVEGVPQPLPPDLLGAFATQLHQALGISVRRLRGEPDEAELPELREAVGHLTRVADDATLPRRVIARQADELVDAVDTLLFAVGARTSRDAATT